MLALVEQQVVLLEEGLATLVAHVRPDVAAAVRVPPLVLRESMLLGEASPAVRADVGLGLRTRTHRW